MAAGNAFCNHCGAPAMPGGSQAKVPAAVQPPAPPANVPPPSVPESSPAAQPEVPTAPAPTAPGESAPPFASVPVPPTPQAPKSQGKGCITALIVTLIVIVVIVLAIVGGMVYVAHKVKNKVQEFAAKEVQQAHDSLSGPKPNKRVDLSDVPGSFAPNAQLAESCPEAAPSSDTETAKVPLHQGLTWINAWRRFNGDVEVINKVEAINPNEVITSSSGLGFPSSNSTHGTEVDTTRHVCRADLQDASAYITENHRMLPQIIPQTTAFSMSQKSLQTLRTSGKLTILFQDFELVYGRMVPVPRTAELTRVEPDDVNYPVILNGQPANLPVIHARGHFQFNGADKIRELYKDAPSDLEGDGEIFVLDDPVNPMMLQFGFGPVFQVRVTTITYPVEQPKPQIEEQLAKQKKAVIYGIYFDFNEATIKKESQPVLKEIADAMKNNPDWVLTVNGYTDNIGGDTYNVDLSKRRAASVKQALVSQYGIAPERLTTNGFGAASPVDRNDTLEGRARNRRVELIRE
jgi:outer membrane protein OmpA-like peptidoglycan-associated protein